MLSSSMCLNMYLLSRQRLYIRAYTHIFRVKQYSNNDGLINKCHNSHYTSPILHKLKIAENSTILNHVNNAHNSGYKTS